MEEKKEKKDNKHQHEEKYKIAEENKFDCGNKYNQEIIDSKG